MKVAKAKLVQAALAYGEKWEEAKQKGTSQARIEMFDLECAVLAAAQKLYVIHKEQR